MSQTRVLAITGCLGFMGSHFTRTCLERGWKVWGIDKFTYASNRGYLDEFLKFPNFRFTEADIATLDHLYEVDVVVNIAAETHVDNSIMDSERFLKSNIWGVQNILELIRAKRNYEMPTLLQISTDEVYGDIIDGKHHENDALKPSNPYSSSKAAADMLILGWHRTYDIPYYIVRPTNNFGQGQYPEKLIPKSVKYLSLGKKIPLHGDGSYKRTWLHVEDFVQGLMSILERGQKNRIYNMSGDCELSNTAVVRMIIDEYFGKQSNSKLEDYAQFSYVRIGEDKRYSLDDSALRTLGWTPSRDFEDELRKLVQHHKKVFTW